MIRRFAKYLGTLCISLLLAQSSFASFTPINLDSLYKVASDINQPDTVLYSAWFQIAVGLSNADNLSIQDSLDVALNQMTKYALNSRVDTLIAEAYTILGAFCENKADFNNSLAYYYKALNFFERIHHKAGICMISESIGVVYKQLFKVEETLMYLNIAHQYIDLPEIKVTYLPRRIYLNKSEIYLYAAILIPVITTS